MAILGVGADRVLIVLTEENLERMAKGDPFDTTINGTVIAIASVTEDDLHKMTSKEGIFKHVFRGYELRKEDDYEPFKIFEGEAKA